MPAAKMSRRTMRAQLKREAWDALAAICTQEDPPPMTVTARNDLAQVTLIVGPPGGKTPQEPKRIGLWLSPREAQLVAAMAGGTALLGKEVAAKAGVEYDGTTKALLSNLVARGIVAQPEDGRGYRLIATA